jgi:uncharacterized protein
MLPDELEKLKNLHAEGALTDEEYEAAKGRLIKTDRVTATSSDLFGLDLPNYLALMHASQFAHFLIPSSGFIAPIVLWLMARDQYPEVDTEGKHILNWMLSLLIYFTAATAVAFTLIGMIITIPAVMLLGLVALIFPIIGIVEATQGRSYKYPIAIEFIK